MFASERCYFCIIVFLLLFEQVLPFSFFSISITFSSSFAFYHATAFHHTLFTPRRGSLTLLSLILLFYHTFNNMSSQHHHRNYISARNVIDNNNTHTPSFNMTVNSHSESSTSPLTDAVTPPTPSEQELTVARRFIEVSGPVPFSCTDGFQGRAVCLTLGTFDCSHPPENPKEWVGHRHADPERSLIPMDEQHLDHHVKHYPDVIASARCQAISLHQLIDHYINGHLSIYPKARSLETLDLVFDFLQPETNALLERVTDSVALVCCYITFFDPSSKDSKKVLEYVTVEYFCSPWTKKWNRRVKRDVVNEKWHNKLVFAIPPLINNVNILINQVPRRVGSLLRQGRIYLLWVSFYFGQPWAWIDRPIDADRTLSGRRRGSWELATSVWLIKSTPIFRNQGRTSVPDKPHVLESTRF